MGLMSTAPGGPRGCLCLPRLLQGLGENNLAHELYSSSIYNIICIYILQCLFELLGKAADFVSKRPACYTMDNDLMLVRAGMAAR